MLRRALLVAAMSGEWQCATGAAPGQFQEEAGTRGYANPGGTLMTTLHNGPSSAS